MADRKKLIGGIMDNFQILKNKMYANVVVGSKTITLSQCFVLSIIGRHSRVTARDIAKMLGISSSAVTQLVNGLVEKGYVVRSPDAKDRRELHLSLSSKGKRQAAVIQAGHKKLASTLFKPLSDQELALFLELQSKIVSYLD